MIYLVCYDISDDALRARMSRALLDFGSRVQESVFECLLNDALYDRMMSVLEKMPLADEDRVRVYRVCALCVERLQIYGPADLTREPDYYVV